MLDYIGDHYLSLLIGFGISIIVSWIAYQKQSLSRSGFYTSIFVGTVIYFCGGLYFMVVLFAFFVSSSLFSMMYKGEKRHSNRTYKQVLANGLIGVVLSVFYVVSNDELFKLLYTISFAVSTADTWASEIGKLSKYKPRNIVTWKQTDYGLSGSVTVLGSIASFGGSVFISLFLLLNYHVILWGFLGSIVDSFLGTLQVKYKLVHGGIVESVEDQQDIEQVLGISWLSNNLVNFMSNVIIVFIAYLVLK